MSHKVSLAVDHRPLQHLIISTGNEAGGHGGGSAPSTALLVTGVLAALPNGPPIVAAGGIATGAQVASVLALGASGALLGTRLLFTTECGYTPEQKELLKQAKLGSTKRGMCFDEVNRTLGWPAGVDGQALATGIWTDFEEGLSVEERQNLYDAGKASGNTERLLVWAGAGAGLTHEFKSAAEVLKDVHEETVRGLQRACAML